MNERGGGGVRGFHAPNGPTTVCNGFFNAVLISRAKRRRARGRTQRTGTDAHRGPEGSFEAWVWGRPRPFRGRDPWEWPPLFRPPCLEFPPLDLTPAVTPCSLLHFVTTFPGPPCHLRWQQGLVKSVLTFDRFSRCILRTAWTVEVGIVFGDCSTLERSRGFWRN